MLMELSTFFGSGSIIFGMKNIVIESFGPNLYLLWNCMIPVQRVTLYFDSQSERPS